MANERLAAFSARELAEELTRRLVEFEQQTEQLSAASVCLFPAQLAGEKKSPLKAEAKVKYWAEWREYKAAHPNATREQWQRARKRTTKK